VYFSGANCLPKSLGYEVKLADELINDVKVNVLSYKDLPRNEQPISGNKDDYYTYSNSVPRRNKRSTLNKKVEPLFKRYNRTLLLNKFYLNSLNGKSRNILPYSFPETESEKSNETFNFTQFRKDTVDKFRIGGDYKSRLRRSATVNETVVQKPNAGKFATPMLIRKNSKVQDIISRTVRSFVISYHDMLEPNLDFTIAFGLLRDIAELNITIDSEGFMHEGMKFNRKCEPFFDMLDSRKTHMISSCKHFFQKFTPPKEKQTYIYYGECPSRQIFDPKKRECITVEFNDPRIYNCFWDASSLCGQNGFPPPMVSLGE